MTIMKMNDKLTDYDPEVLKKLHDIELMIFSDFIDICDKNNINYFAAYGTALGAIRHGGFIPWDDDIDIFMLRNDYNKFLEIMGKGNEKYDFFAMETTDKYFKVFGKLSLKGTKSYDFWQENVDFIMGINIDIFILDNVPLNNFKKNIYIKRRFLHRKLSWLLEVLNSDMYISKNKERLGHLIKVVFRILGINQKFLLNQNKSLRNEDINSNEVCEISDGVIYPKYLFDSVKKVKFENIEINLPEDYDSYLKITFGDYMVLPPEEERFNHSTDIDFGGYE